MGTAGRMWPAGRGLAGPALHNGITWHNFTYISINTRRSLSHRKIIDKRNFKRFNPNQFLHDASVSEQFKVNTESTYQTTDEMADELETTITALINKHAPIKRIRVRPTRKHWITKELLNIISRKNRLFKQSTKNEDPSKWEIYKQFRNNAKCKIKIAKETYYRNKIQNAESNDKWKVINVLANKTIRINDIPELRHKNKTYTNSEDISNVLNMFLSTIGSEINTELKQTNHAVGTSSLLNRTGFKFEPVTEMSVINTMQFKK